MEKPVGNMFREKHGRQERAVGIASAFFCFTFMIAGTGTARAQAKGIPNLAASHVSGHPEVTRDRGW